MESPIVESARAPWKFPPRSRLHKANGRTTAVADSQAMSTTQASP